MWKAGTQGRFFFLLIHMNFKKLNSLLYVDAKKILGYVRLWFRRRVCFGNTDLGVIIIKMLFIAMGLVKLLREE